MEEQFYLLWPEVLKRWHAQRTAILMGVVALAPLYRVACHFAGLHGQADETFPAVADVLAIGCLLAIHEARVPKISRVLAAVMTIPVVLVPVYLGSLHFHLTPMLLFALWPAMHLSIAGLLLHVVRSPYGFLNARPVAWLGKISYSLYLWQQLFAFGTRPRPWYLLLVPLALASASYYSIEQPILRLREARSRQRQRMTELAEAA